jgi:hypothetical protein
MTTSKLFFFKGKVILRNGTIIEADFSNDRIITPLTSDMTSMLQIELPELVSKTPIPSGKQKRSSY